MEGDLIPFTELLSKIVDNRGRTCPTSDTGLPLIATNCIRNDRLYPSFDNVRHVSKETYNHWFRGHPEPGDLIFTCKGTPGRVCMTPDPVPFCIAQDMVAIRADPKKIHPKYLFALLRSKAVQDQIGNMHVGTLIPHFKKGDFHKLLLPVPDKRAQEFIGNTYFELSALIELNRQTNEILEEMARALFKSWFVDFDPVRAKLEGRQPAGMDAATAALFPAHFQDSELGQIPMGWEVVTVGDLATLKGGSQLEKESFSEHGTIPIFGGAGIMGYGELHNADGFVISVGRVGAYCGQYFYHRGKAWINNNASLIRQREEIPGEWLLLCLRDINMEVIKKGAAQPFVSNSDIAAVKVLLPPNSILDRFQDLIRPLFLSIESNQTESHDLATLRDTLLPKLLSGEVRVKEYQSEISNVI